MRVLIVKLSSLGDVVHTLPALASLRKGLASGGGRVEIDWLVEEAASGILRNNPLIDNLIIVGRRGWTRSPLANLKTARFLASRRYDMVLDFQGLMKSGIWVFLSKGKRRIGFSNAREFSALFFNERLPAYDPDRHAVDRYLDLARYAGGATDRAEFFHEEFDDYRLRALLKETGTGPGGYVVISPSARWTTKEWDDRKFGALGRSIIDRYKLTILVSGSDEEKKRAARIAEFIGPGGISVAGRLGLEELPALFAGALVAVTVDSGAMHVAAAAGTPVVALFGPTAPWRTGPYGEGHIVVRKDIDCSPCFKRKCRDTRCMKDIEVEEVMKAVDRALSGRLQGRMKGAGPVD